ncbi:unnamed protein product [Adineta steineri]|uniref:F-box domain-containing protein n=1 Tax=Adineta steineri TaxID=433720 RepID=A0A819QBL5_9BILA|nr:unnamed protein product [Adineta steineri]CAF4022282.1 unnamed protein product [Adineta steineri]
MSVIQSNIANRAKFSNILYQLFSRTGQFFITTLNPIFTAINKRGITSTNSFSLTQQEPQLISLESLPSELFYHEIFIYLNSVELIDAFFNINSRFHNLIYAYLYQHVDLDSISWELTHRYCYSQDDWIPIQANEMANFNLTRIQFTLTSIQCNYNQLRQLFPLSYKDFSILYPQLRALSIQDIWFQKEVPVEFTSI